MGPFGYLQKQIRPDVREFADAASQRRRGAARPNVRAEFAERRAPLNERPSDDWLSAAARTYAGGTVAPSPQGVVRAIDAAFAKPDAVSRGAYWWLIAEAWERSGRPAELPRALGAVLAEHFRLDPAFEGLEDVANMWMDGISKEIDDARSKLRGDAGSERLMEALAGTDRAEIERSVADAARFLAHPIPGRRIAAMKLLAEASEKPAWLSAKLREMASSDPDHAVRANAIAHLNNVHMSTRDAGLLSFLARISLDDTQPRPVRFLAYHGLFVVSGAPSDEWPYAKVMASSHRRGVPFFAGKDDAWPCDMDWELAASFLKPEEAP